MVDPTRRRRARRRLLIGASAAVVAVLVLVGLNTLAHHRGWIVERRTPEALSAELSPFYRIHRPDGPARFPPPCSIPAVTAHTTTCGAGPTPSSPMAGQR